MRPSQLGQKYVFRLKSAGETQLHAGLHKTGSTSLQRSLRSAGILQNARRRDFRDPDAFRRILLEAKQNRLVVSSEHLLGEMGDLYSTAVERFQFVQKHIDQSQLTVYLRPHGLWHASAYAQFVQQGTLLSSIDYENLVEPAKYFSFNQLATDLLSVSSSSARLQVRVAADVVVDYAGVIGVPLRRTNPQNSSLSPMALEALVRIRNEGSALSDTARVALADFMPESRLTSSVFSRRFQARLVAMKSDWLQLMKTMAAAGCDISGSWLSAYDREIRPPASEIFSEHHLEAAKKCIRLAARRRLTNL